MEFKNIHISQKENNICLCRAVPRGIFLVWLFSMPWASENTVKIDPFPEKPQVRVTKHRWYFLRYIPRPGRHIPQGGARTGRRLFAPAHSREQPRPLDFRKPLLRRTFPKGIPSWKAMQPCWNPPSATVTGQAVPLQGSACSSLPCFRSLPERCCISSQQWCQRVAKGNPRTAKSILDINSLSRLRLRSLMFGVCHGMFSTRSLNWNFGLRAISAVSCSRLTTLKRTG